MRLRESEVRMRTGSCEDDSDRCNGSVVLQISIFLCRYLGIVTSLAAETGTSGVICTSQNILAT